jgi:hypothetical protein
MTKTLIKAALLVPMLAAGLATTASASGHDSYGYKHYGHVQYGHVKSFGWYKPVHVVKIVPVYKTCSVWSYHNKVCLKWH